MSVRGVGQMCVHEAFEFSGEVSRERGLLTVFVVVRHDDRRHVCHQTAVALRNSAMRHHESVGTDRTDTAKRVMRDADIG